MTEPLDFYSLSREEIRELNAEIAKMRYEMHEAESSGKYYFINVDIDSLPYEELKEEYESMLSSL